DSETLSILTTLKSQVEIIFGNSGSGREMKTGGLYSNMNLALEISEREGVDEVLFLQDDMQLVRRISDRETLEISTFFSENPRVIQLQTCFIGQAKIMSGTSISQFEIDRSGFAYFCKPEYEGGKSNFS